MEKCVVCAVIFPFFRRLFSSFVLTCFLWTTLFQTIAFANFERAIPVHASLEREEGVLKSIRLNIGVQNFDPTAGAVQPYPSRWQTSKCLCGYVAANNGFVYPYR